MAVPFQNLMISSLGNCSSSFKGRSFVHKGFGNNQVSLIEIAVVFGIGQCRFECLCYKLRGIFIREPYDFISIQSFLSPDHINDQPCFAGCTSYIFSFGVDCFAHTFGAGAGTVALGASTRPTVPLALAILPFLL